MLQPALNPPTRKPLAPNTTALDTPPHTDGTPASYGSLIAATRDTVDRALADSNLRQPAADAALPGAATVQVLALARAVDVASLGKVLTWALRRRSTQIGVLFAWWWLGWHFITNR